MEFAEIARAVGALALTLGLMAVGVALLRRFAPKMTNADGTSLMPLVRRMPVDPKRALLVVEFAGESHLILTGPGADLVIAKGQAPLRADTVDVEATASSVETAPGGFAPFGRAA